MATYSAAAGPVDHISSIKAGLPYRSFSDLAAELAVSAAELAQVIQVAPRTLQRRKQEGVFAPDESDRLFRIVRLLQRTQEVIGPEAPA